MSKSQSHSAHKQKSKSTISDSVDLRYPQGQEVQLSMNLFPVQISNISVMKYHWDIAPPMNNPKNAYSIVELALIEMQIQEYIIDVSKHRLLLKRKYDNFEQPVSYQNTPYVVKIWWVDTEDLSKSAALQNQILGNVYESQGFEQIARNYYYAPESLQNCPNQVIDRKFSPKEINNGIFQLKQGVSAKIHPATEDGFTGSENNMQKHQKTPLPTHTLEMDLTSKLIHNYSILTLIQKWQNDGKSKAYIEEQLLGQRFLTEYNNHVYTLHAIAWDMTPRSTFNSRGKQSSRLKDKTKNLKEEMAELTTLVEKQGEMEILGSVETSFQSYLEQKYAVKVSEANQPLLVSTLQSRKKSSEIDKESISKLYFIPEFCFLVGFGDANTAFRVRQEVTKITQKPPQERQKKLSGLVKSPELSKGLENWGMKVEHKMVNCEGVRCSPLKIVAGNGALKINQVQANWLSAINRSECLDPPQLQKWMILCEETTPKQLVKKFAQEFCEGAEAMGMSCAHPKIQIERNMIHFLQKLERIQKSKEKTTSKKLNLQLIVTISPNMQKTRYRTIKELCHERIGVPNQNVVLKSLQNSKRSHDIIRGLFRQIVCKVPTTSGGSSGALWEVSNLTLPPNTMLVGIDVWHGKTMKDHSIAGIVISFDGGLHFITSYCHLSKGTEIIPNLGDILGKALTDEHANHGKVVENIVIYRDGVGDSQFRLILQEELTSLKSYLSQSRLYREILPKIAIIAVNKRIHRRLFQHTGSSATEQGVKNLDPGIYTEDGITQSSFPNYYLVAHYSRFGTSLPVHLSILFNNTTCTSRDLVEIANQLCAQYYNWAGSIRVPSPIEYAHKVADHLGSNRITSISAEILRTLFFL